jgi:hypothetical protein
MHTATALSGLADGVSATAGDLAFQLLRPVSANTICLILMAGSFATGVSAVAEPSPITLVPAASEVQWGEAVDLPGSAGIVLSDQAGPPEREAAKVLARYVERRFGRQWPIHSAKDAPADMKLRAYLGQRRTFPELDRLCTEQNISVPEQREGYALKVWSRGETVTAVVAGTDARGVTYGQDTLFQLLVKRGDRITLQAATIRDWPTIPLRGRPHPAYQYYLKSENFDCMMSSRVNFIDLRNSIYAFEPGAQFNKDEIRTVITEARKRDLRVYAVVNCGLPADKHDAIIATFKEFLDLGADALWASFDDQGAGEAPQTILTRMIALGRERGITGDAIAITPPKGDYQTIKTRFNREMVGVPGMEEAVWYWTSIPCAEDLADGQSIGLKIKPSWWHNWPRLPHASLGEGGYTPIPSLAVGWNKPNEQELREMGNYVHAILPWDGWMTEQHYLVPTIGWWSWRPEKHDFQDVRRRAYDMVFGPGQIQAAMAFDDGLSAVGNQFAYWTTQTDYAPKCPPRLKSLDSREQVGKQLQTLKATLASLRQGSKAGSVLSPELLQQDYLDPMAREVEAGLAEIQAPYPEYGWAKHQDAVLRAIHDGRTAEADQLIAGARESVLKDIARVEALLGPKGIGQNYIAWWKARANATVADWQKLLARRQIELEARCTEYNKNIILTEKLLSDLNDPPVQFGTYLWERHNHVLATVTPEPREVFWGDWIGGVRQEAGRQVAVFVMDPQLDVNAGGYCEMPVNIPVSGRRDRLALMIYLADFNKELYGLGRARWRWAGLQSIHLLWDQRELWKADLGITRLTGEWFIVPLPTIPADLKTLSLRLRVEDDHSSIYSSRAIAYIGPIRLLELDRD